ncbi:hypothetical protein ACP275_01G007000 [Erythranthe tilingii]
MSMTMDATQSTAMEFLKQAVSEVLKHELETVNKLDDMLRSIHQIRRLDLIKDAGSRKHSGVYIRTQFGYTLKEKMCFMKGIKLYENLITVEKLSRLNDFVNELRVAGQNGKLSGETFGSYNQHTRKNREFIQFGVPMFELIKVDKTNQFPTRYIEPIPTLLQGLIEEAIQRNWIPKDRRPNGCIINFFDEGEYSHPFVKPPHLDQPISILILSESRMAFGDTILGETSNTILGDGKGNYRRGFILSPLKEGSLLILNGISSDIVHAMCASPNKRIIITFFKVHT